MRTYLKSFLLGALAVGVSSAIFAQTPTVSLSMDSGSFTLVNKSGVALSGGSDAKGDGFALQLGYYSASTAGDLFAGTWTAFAGVGTSTFSNLSIGDDSANGAGAGTFAFGPISFIGGTENMPGAGKIVALRFYDATSIAGSNFFGSVSSASWTWVAPSFPPTALNFSLDDGGVVWLGNNVASTGTAIIPEPSTYALIFGGLTLGVVIARRRTKK